MNVKQSMWKIKYSLHDSPSVCKTSHAANCYISLLLSAMRCVIIFNSPLYYNPYGHNILKYYHCVHKACNHFSQPCVPWGLVKCSLIPYISLNALIECHLHDYFLLINYSLSGLPRVLLGQRNVVRARLCACVLGWEKKPITPLFLAPNAGAYHRCLGDTGLQPIGKNRQANGKCQLPLKICRSERGRWRRETE